MDAVVLLAGNVRVSVYPGAKPKVERYVCPRGWVPGDSAEADSILRQNLRGCGMTLGNTEWGVEDGIVYEPSGTVADVYGDTPEIVDSRAKAIAVLPGLIEALQEISTKSSCSESRVTAIEALIRLC